MDVDNWLKFLRQSPYVILILVLGYFGKVYIENQIDSVNVRVNEISKSSLSIKEDIRGEERRALIAFRIALEKWEDYLLASLANLSNIKINTQSINDYYKKEGELRLAVKVAVATLGVILQNEDAYIHSLSTITGIANTYYPFVKKYLPDLIDLQTKIEPIEYRMKQFEKSLNNGTKFEYTIEQAKADQKLNLALQTEMTEVVQQFSNELLVIYPKLAEQLADLKISMNEQVYRPITSYRLDAD